MATDFFQRQDDARRSTTWLVAMFCFAVIFIVSTVVVVAALLISSQTPPPGEESSHAEQMIIVPTVAGLITLAIILGGSAFKVVQLRHGGGSRVAESLGGRRIYPNAPDRSQRRLLNVVEEMALASGTPVPPVYLLDEDGINAFAAGYSSSDAVLGVTRGAVEQLNRDELQGVIAHEFSHILNGDMRMSIRLIGILHGILLIGLTGQLLLRTFVYSGHGRSRRDSKSNGQVILAILAIAVLAIVLGFIGTFFGNLIKAAVSRQREYLADASAVQFTRNPSGIADALKKIGGATSGSKLEVAGAAEASHMYFAQGVWEGLSGLWATHPPLPQRIRAVEPGWDGEFIQSRSSGASTSAAGTAAFAGSPESVSGGQSGPVSGGQSPSPVQASGTDRSNEVSTESIDDAIQHVGEPSEQHQHYAQAILRDLPAALIDAVHEPYGARAVVHALLLDRDPEIQQTQLESLRQFSQPDVVQLVEELYPLIDALETRSRLPLIDLAVPSLRAMSAKQFNDFRRCFSELIRADEKMDLFEWVLSQVLMRHVQPQFEYVRGVRARYYGLQRLGPQCSVVLSIISAAGNDQAKAESAFAAAAERLPDVPLQQQWPAPKQLNELRQTLSELQYVNEKHRGRLIDACAGAIAADGHVNWQEAELLRGIADLLDCPLPPFVSRA